MKLGDPAAVRRRPLATSGECDSPEAVSIHETLAALRPLATVATPALANRIAGDIARARKPLSEALESIRAAADVAGRQADGNNPLKSAELINLVCGYAAKPRPQQRTGPGGARAPSHVKPRDYELADGAPE